MIGGFRIAGLALLLPFLAGCASQNVYFFDRPAPQAKAGATHIYVDAFGSLYPTDGLPKVVTSVDQDAGWLHNMASREASGFCADATEHSETRRLCEASESLPNSLDEWRDAQVDLWKARARAVLADMRESGEATTLVILIHGFNNNADEASDSYKIARHLIQENAVPTDRLHFVELYWDGFKSQTGVGAWGKAQASGPAVGFSFRAFFNALIEVSNEEKATVPRIRIVTHSSGAFVVGGLVGNPTAALPLLRRVQPYWSPYHFFREKREASEGPYAVPQLDDLRIGMLAAATSSDTFTGTRKHPGGVLTKGATFYLSVMPKDEVLTKLFLGADFPFSGATGLGAKYAYFCNQISRSETLAERNVTFYGYDFRRDKGMWGDDHNAHDFATYLLQAAGETNFLSDLMSHSDEQGQEVASRIGCN